LQTRNHGDEDEEAFGEFAVYAANELTGSRFEKEVVLRHPDLFDHERQSQMTPSDRSSREYIVWRGAILAFSLAAATGAFFRFGVAYGFTSGINFANARHAHSHLMYFAWVTPALFLLITARLFSITGREVQTASKLGMISSLILGWLSYIPFLILGYSPMTIGALTLPPSVILAGLNMFSWYLFIWGYVRQTRGLQRRRAIALFDGALLFLVLASLGAWGISVATPLGADGLVLTTAFTHVFLDYFSEGWLLLAVLGLAISFIKEDRSAVKAMTVATWMLVSGISISFLLGMPRSVVSPPAQLLARIAGSFMAVGLLVILRQIFRRSDTVWRVPAIFLSLKTLGLFIVCITPTIWWSELYAERILYLHIHVLGFVSLGIVAAASQIIGGSSRAQRLWINLAVSLVVLSLIPLTTFWPASFRGVWILFAMAWLALKSCNRHS